jgi:Flp pilus assembly CpaE family ATPase
VVVTIIEIKEETITEELPNMEADVLSILKSRLVYISGGVDLDSNQLIIYQLPHEIQPWTKRYLEVSTRYLLNAQR